MKDLRRKRRSTQLYEIPEHDENSEVDENPAPDTYRVFNQVPEIHNTTTRASGTSNNQMDSDTSYTFRKSRSLGAINLSIAE